MGCSFGAFKELMKLYKHFNNTPDIPAAPPPSWTSRAAVLPSSVLPENNRAASTKWPATAAVYKQKLCPKIILGLKTVSEKEIYEIMDSLGLGGYHNLHEVLKLLQLTTFTEKEQKSFYLPIALAMLAVVGRLHGIDCDDIQAACKQYEKFSLWSILLGRIGLTLSAYELGVVVTLSLC
eukprot:gene10841-2917_t